jgi:hypothetical protein
MLSASCQPQASRPRKRNRRGPANSSAVRFRPRFGDDAGAIKLHNIGVLVTTVLVPARSTHAHSGIIDRADFDRTADLMVALIQSLDAATWRSSNHLNKAVTAARVAGFQAPASAS